MPLLTRVYKFIHRGIKDEEIPYYWKYSLSTIVKKPLRKWMSAAVIPYIPFNELRVILYKLIGYKIGKGTFIGMRCYLDDMCFDLIRIGNNVTISYGVFFACHGRKQGHNPIVIEDGAYIGMRSCIIARKDGGIIIGKDAVVGACSLVNKSVPACAIVVGIPAKELKRELL